MPAGRVLVCDDELPVVRAIEVKLRAAGYDVRSTFAVGDAWREQMTEPFDLVIAACPMERTDGLELARRVRAEESMQHTPIILLTGKGHEMPADDLIASDLVQRVLEKPFSPRNLVEDVRAILDQARRQEGSVHSSETNA